MKNREPFKTSLQEAFAFSCFFRREERASAKVLRDYVTRIKALILAKVVYLRMNQRHPQSRHTPHGGTVKNRHRERYPRARA